MKILRRDFLKLTAAAGVAAAFGGLGFSLSPAQAAAQEFRLKGMKQTTSVCCYCAVGCGLIVHTDPLTGRSVNVEGNPDHPVNEGTRCSKGASIWMLAEKSPRVLKPMYRAPYSDVWEEKSWDWMLDAIAKRVKKSRDADFTFQNAKGQTVNRTEAIASVGSAAIDNEEAWLIQAIMRHLGLTYVEHQARICHSSTVPALAETYGRGAMTNHWNDIANADVILIMGSNAAENHPISFRWVGKAMDKGATLIHVDPRFTRTSAKAHHYAPMRAGTDIAFFGGMINYILQHNLQFTEYVAQYTNCSFILTKDYGFKDGMFAGYDAAANKYDKKAWAFELDEAGVPKKDLTLKHPRCVFQQLKKHYARYTPEKVSAVTGTPLGDVLKVYKLYCATGKPDKVATMMYAMGQTQHTVGVQNIRAMAMIQLLLGNVGVAGGGINALRGESNVQGATDHAVLYHILPGYLGTPQASLDTFAKYNEKNTPVTKDPKSANWWGNFPKYSASYLKAIFPAMDPDKGYELMPKLDDGQNASWLVLFDQMLKGRFTGAFVWGQNPACGGANADKNRKGMAKLDWMVNVNIFDNESGSFWKGPGMDPKQIKTEVFFLPCCVSVEKEGSVTNSGRWSQWRYVGPEPMGESKSDGEILCLMADRIKKLYAKEGGPLAEAILGMNVEGWTTAGHYDPHKVARLINGYFTRDVTIKGALYKAGTLVPSFAFLQDDGSTSSGNWLYCASYTEKGNMAERMSREQTPMQANIGLYPNWTWCWPVNRRIIYNRASVDLAGKPWDPKRAVIAWEGDKWVGDVPDGGWKPGDKYPFIMKTEGHAHMFGPGRVEGPFPEHYEPMESPLAKHPFSKVRSNPMALQFKEEYKAAADPKFPIVCTTFRCTEHWQTGVMTRHNAWLLETHPHVWCEISPELGKKLGVKNGDMVEIESVRHKLNAVAMVTERIRPLTIMGKTIHQIGVSWQFGWQYPENMKGGDSANLLTPSVGDANTGIPETKAFMVNVRKA